MELLLLARADRLQVSGKKASIKLLNLNAPPKPLQSTNFLYSDVLLFFPFYKILYAILFSILLK